MVLDVHISLLFCPLFCNESRADLAAGAFRSLAYLIHLGIGSTCNPLYPSPFIAFPGLEMNASISLCGMFYRSCLFLQSIPYPFCNCINELFGVNFLVVLVFFRNIQKVPGHDAGFYGLDGSPLNLIRKIN